MDMAILLGIFFMLVPFFVIMVLESRRKRPNPEQKDEKVGYNGYDENPEEEYQPEEEGDLGDNGDNETTMIPTKIDQTPLWKYFTRPEAGKGGGTTKFICPHCNTQYTGLYPCARRHLCGKRPWDGDKNIGIKTCVSVSATDRAKYIREEEEPQYKSRRSKGVIESYAPSQHGQRSPSTSTHGIGYGGTPRPNISLRRRTISDFLDEGSRSDVDAKIFRYLYACGVPFNVLRSPYRHDKARTVGLDHEKEKITHSLSRMTSSWNEHGLSIVSDGWTNVKGKPLISVLTVSVSGAIFLSSYDYLDKFKTGINISEPLLETIERIGPYNVIQVITDNAANCKAAGEIIEDKYPNIFWSGCLVHKMNLLMHDIIKTNNLNTNGLVI